MSHSILFLVSLIIHSVVVCRHRAKGMHSKVSRGRVGNEAFPMAPQPHANYAAVPQQGMPFNQHQDTAYNPNQMYNPPPAAAAAYSPHQQHQHQHQHQQQHQQQHTGGFYPSPQSFYAPPPSHSPQPVSELPYEKNVSPAPLHAVYEVPGSTASPYQPPAYQPPNQI